MNKTKTTSESLRDFLPPMNKTRLWIEDIDFIGKKFHENYILLNGENFNIKNILFSAALNIKKFNTKDYFLENNFSDKEISLKLESELPNLSKEILNTEASLLEMEQTLIFNYKTNSNLIFFFNPKIIKKNNRLYYQILMPLYKSFFDNPDYDKVENVFDCELFKNNIRFSKALIQQSYSDDDDVFLEIYERSFHYMKNNLEMKYNYMQEKDYDYSGIEVESDGTYDLMHNITRDFEAIYEISNKNKAIRYDSHELMALYTIEIDEKFHKNTNKIISQGDEKL